MSSSSSAAFFFDQNGILRKGFSQPLHNKLEELQRILQADDPEDKPGQRWFIIHTGWLISWLSFVQSKGDFTPAPGPVSNNMLVDVTNKAFPPFEGLRQIIDYRRVNEEVWDIYVELYGGGPGIWVVGEPYDDPTRWTVRKPMPPVEPIDEHELPAMDTVYARVATKRFNSGVNPVSPIAADTKTVDNPLESSDKIIKAQNAKTQNTQAKTAFAPSLSVRRMISSVKNSEKKTKARC